MAHDKEKTCVILIFFFLIPFFITYRATFRPYFYQNTHNRSLTTIVKYKKKKTIAKTRLEPELAIDNREHDTAERNIDTELNLQHPHCSLDHLFSSGEKNGKVGKYLDEVGTYKLIDRDTTLRVSYNHQCPYYLKDRYNCERNSTDILRYGEKATDWELVLKTEKTECNLGNFIHNLGGPVGVAKALSTQHGTAQRRIGAARDNNKDTTNEKTKRPFNVVMMGNSYLRQIFEALACGWSTDITDYRVTVNSTLCFTSQCVEDIYPLDEFGDVVPPLMKTEGSQIPDGNKQHFYRPGVKLPIKVFSHTFNDHLSMLEFGNSIRFYYIFRAHNHANLTGVFEQKFHLNPADVDMLLFNAEEDKYITRWKNLVDIFISTGVWQKKSVWQLRHFVNMQMRDIGRWFGADNPWITSVPDNHACLPGVPDDEVNLILYLLFANARITDEGSGNNKRGYVDNKSDK